MTNIWLPPRLTQIGKEAFLSCIALQEVVIPTELQEIIGIRAFCGCEQSRVFALLDWGRMTNTYKQNTTLFCHVTILSSRHGWSCYPPKDRIRTHLMRSFTRNFLDRQVFHQATKAGALAPVLVGICPLCCPVAQRVRTHLEAAFFFCTGMGAMCAERHKSPSLNSDFFPRVRTPCGHGAQVIVEGREEQSDGGEKNNRVEFRLGVRGMSPARNKPPTQKTNTNQKKTNKQEEPIVRLKSVRV